MQSSPYPIFFQNSFKNDFIVEGKDGYLRDKLLSGFFNVSSGLKQDCLLSPPLFFIVSMHWGQSVVSDREY